jgi:hypothetical protein
LGLPLRAKRVYAQNAHGGLKIWCCDLAKDRIRLDVLVLPHLSNREGCAKIIPLRRPRIATHSGFKYADGVGCMAHSQLDHAANVVGYPITWGLRLVLGQECECLVASFESG